MTFATGLGVDTYIIVTLKMDIVTTAACGICQSNPIVKEKKLHNSSIKLNAT